jgi:predicted outer membrane repeat protein
MVAALLFAVALGAPQSPRAADPVTTLQVRVTLTSFTMDPGLDFPDFPDPYAQININGTKKNIGLPGCNGVINGCISSPDGITHLDDTYFFQLGVPLTLTSIPVALSLWDSDSFPRGDDDNASLTRHGDIRLNVDPATGQWTGDATFPTDCIINGSNRLCWKIAVGGGLNDANCNGLDEDGDGTPDNHFFGVATCGLGLCTRAVGTTCVAGVETPTATCVPGAPSPEVLDDRDDDCDGVIDNGVSPDTNCNGLDEDNNGTPDDQFPGGKLSCGVGQCTRSVDSICVQGVETPKTVACTPGAPSSEQLNGLDDDCDGTVDDDIGTLTCTPNQTDWWCCPNGADLVFSVTTTADPLAESPAASACLPNSVPRPPGATCSLRGVLRRAEQVRRIVGLRQVCRVVAELPAGDYQLNPNLGDDSFLHFGGGSLTIKGLGAKPSDVIIEPPAGGLASKRILDAGLRSGKTFSDERGEQPPTLTIQNLTIRRGSSDSFSKYGGGGIVMNPFQPGAVLTIQDAIFDRNHAAQEGGAVQFWTTGTLTILRSVFRSNDSPNALVNARGGAVSAAGAIVRIEDSAFTQNFGKFGGAVALDDCTSLLVNNTFSQNRSEFRGGAIGTTDGRLVLRFNTIFANFMPSGAIEGGGIATFDTQLVAFGNIIAGNSHNGADAKGRSPDCSIFFAGTPDVTAGSNIVGAVGIGNTAENPSHDDGSDCARLGAPDGRLIGTVAAPIDPQLNALPQTVPVGAPSICGAAGVPSPNTPCTSVCEGETAATCISGPKLVPASPALSAFPTGASPSGDPNTCPLIDQTLKSRTSAKCTLGSVEPTATMRMLSTGNVQIAIRLPGPPVAYIEAFARQNGVQNVSGDFRSSQVANADGSYTYSKVVSGGSYHTGDALDVRFYYYRAGSAAAFLPGPTASAWYPPTIYQRPTDTPSARICKKTNGDMQFALTLGARQAYVEAFATKNGVQNIAGGITGSAVVNMNGTVTYTRTVSASTYKAADVIRARFYHYEVRSPGTFEPGPAEQAFYPSVVYGSVPACP